MSASAARLPSPTTASGTAGGHASRWANAASTAFGETNTASAYSCRAASAARSGARKPRARAAASVASAASVIAATRALPTTTPSAASAIAAALAASLIPKPASTDTGQPARIDASRAPASPVLR